MSPSVPKMNARVAKQIARALAAADRGACFGPSFFLNQLGGLVRERCPKPEERIGIVELHLATGEILELCHIISLTPKWAVLATFAERTGHREGALMRTELIPYEAIVRVGIRSEARSEGRIGFGQTKAPEVALERSVGAEQLLARAAQVSPRSP